MKTKYIRRTLVLVALLAVVLFAKPIIFQGAKNVTFTTAPALSGQITQVLATGGRNTRLSVAGKDYKLSNTSYLENQAWVVTTIIRSDTDNSLVILQKRNGIFQVVMGPGTAFAYSYVRNLPSSVAQYLIEHGAVYDSVN